MSLTVSSTLVAATKSQALESHREDARELRGDREIVIESATLEDEALADLAAAAGKVEDAKTARALESILAARGGVFDKPVPNFKAFTGVLEAFLKAGLLDGWIYVTGDDGKLYPELVTRVSFHNGDYHRRASDQSVRIHTTSYGLSSDGRSNEILGVHEASHSFSPQMVAKRRIADILAAVGIYRETPDLKKAYLVSLERHRTRTRDAFGKQFRFSGGVYRYEEENYLRRGAALQNRRVVHDLDSSDFGPLARHAESTLFEGIKGDGTGEIPEHPLLRVFDLATHEFLWVNAELLEPYRYDKSLREKLILPKSHRDLLDVLTTNLGAFVEDIIEGKSAGNVILCKGIPGVGKTLTAEVYAELTERPLYSVHSGALGTTPETIEKNLRVIFQRSKRWGCVLLLDEADVFVVERGGNIEQNAIVAEFLRVLEYFDGLLFMTTNRPHDIDEAIISRCAAIIDYKVPAARDAAAIWRVMAEKYQTSLSEELLQSLLALFPEIAPRDIKMLLRLALRVCAAEKQSLSVDTFRRCAMFRAVRMTEEGAPAS